MVYNNTLLNDGGANGTAGLNWSNITAAGYTFTYKNNAIQGFYTLINDDDNGSEGTTIAADYNVYSGCASGHSSCLQAFYPGGTSNWASFIAAANTRGPSEQHSTNTGLWSGTACCSGTLGLNSDLTPQSTSAVRGAGVNLYSVCNGQPNPGLGALCSDYLGVARPTSAAWDAGAIQYSSGTNYSLTVSVSGTGAGTFSGTNCVAGVNSYASGTGVVCNATATSGTFTFWTGTGSASGCTGSGGCSFTLTSNTTVIAVINLPITMHRSIGKHIIGGGRVIQ